MLQITFDNIHGDGYIYLDVLRSICADTNGKSMVDLGCNHAPYTNQLNFSKRVYVDILPRTLDNKNEQQYFIQEDILEFLRDNNQYYDVTIASDVIEHLSEMNGVKLLVLMEKTSDKQIIFTPLGDYMVDKVGTDPEGHHSGWMPEHFPDYITIVFKHYHKILNIGAFFAFKCPNLEEEFERVKAELKTKSWAK